MSCRSGRFMSAGWAVSRSCGPATCCVSKKTLKPRRNPGSARRPANAAACHRGDSQMTEHKVVSKEEWLKARLAHWAAEKEFTRKRDEVTRQRQELPWERVETNYVFQGPSGPETLADLFAGRSQLIVYH